MRHLSLRYVNHRSLHSSLTSGTSSRRRSVAAWLQKAFARPDALKSTSGQLRVHRDYSQRNGPPSHNEGHKTLPKDELRGESAEQENINDTPSPVSIPGAGFASRISKSPLFDALITTSIGITIRRGRFFEHACSASDIRCQYSLVDGVMSNGTK